MDCLADTVIGSTSAGVGHLCIDVRVRGVWWLWKERHGCQDLPRLAVAALRNIKLLPGKLYRMRSISRQPFDCGDLPAGSSACLQITGSHRNAINQDGASAALTDAAAVLRTGQTNRIAEHPQEGCLRLGIHGILDAINKKSDRHIGTSFSADLSNCF